MEAGERKRGTPAWRLPSGRCNGLGPLQWGDLLQLLFPPQVCPCWE